MPRAFRKSRFPLFRMQARFFLSNELPNEKFKGRIGSHITNEIDDVQERRFPGAWKLQKKRKGQEPGIERAVISIYGSAPGTASIVLGNVEVRHAVMVDQQAMRPRLQKTQHHDNRPE